MADGYLVRMLGSVELHPHFTTDSSMEFTHAIGGARILQRQNRHAERLGGVVEHHTTQIHQRFMAELQVGGEGMSGVAHQIAAEAVVTRLHRGVCREEALLASFNPSFGVALACSHLLAHELESQERRMTFIHVEGGRLDAQCPQEAHTTDAQQDFLHDARGAVAAINPQCEIAVHGLILGPIGVEQVDGHPTDIHAPGLETHRRGGDLH